MELRQLRAFVQVTHAGTFTRAAEELHLAQSAVSQRGRPAGGRARLRAAAADEPRRRADRGRARWCSSARARSWPAPTRSAPTSPRSPGLLEGTVALGTMLPPGPVEPARAAGALPRVPPGHRRPRARGQRARDPRPAPARRPRRRRHRAAGRRARRRARRRADARRGAAPDRAAAAPPRRAGARLARRPRPASRSSATGAAPRCATRSTARCAPPPPARRSSSRATSSSASASSSRARSASRSCRARRSRATVRASRRSRSALPSGR